MITFKRNSVTPEKIIKFNRVEKKIFFKEKSLK